MGNATESTLPHGNTSGYDRKACRTCACSTCYEQEFCDRCSSCQNQSRKLDRCNAYEGAYSKPLNQYALFTRVAISLQIHKMYLI